MRKKNVGQKENMFEKKKREAMMEALKNESTEASTDEPEEDFAAKRKQRMEEEAEKESQRRLEQLQKMEADKKYFENSASAALERKKTTRGTGTRS